MTSTALVIPDPADYRPEAVADLSAAALAWVERADDIGAVVEMMTRLAALEEYIAKRDPSRLGDLQLANRRAEARIGELLGETTPGARTDLQPSPARDGLKRRQDRVEFRRLARHLADWYPDKGRQSRAKILNLVKRLERVADESAARVIIDADPGDGLTTTETGWVMHCGDAADTLATLPDASIDLIVTDPPYPAESAHLWSLLAQHAKRLLAPSGVLAALSGKIALPDVIGRLGEHLQYGWCYCEPMPGAGTRIIGRHVSSVWKPWLVYTAGPWPSGRIDWHVDMLDPSPRDKGDYRWQQNPSGAAQITERFTDPGATVLDPFAGVGSHGVAAVATGRRFIGIEQDRGRYLQACDRIGPAADRVTR